jgi:hypothetical protein
MSTQSLFRVSLHNSIFLRIAAMILFCFCTSLGAQEWEPKRTEFGQPDFQGNWTNTTFTPLSRPEELGDKMIYTETEALELEVKKLNDHNEKAAPIDPDRPAPLKVEAVDDQAEFIFLGSHLSNAKVQGEYRTSLIVHPKDGRIPLIEENRENTIFGQWRAQGFGDFDGPEIRDAGERCLSDYGPMPPLKVVPGSSNFQFVQTQNHVVLYGEPGAEARILKIDGKHQPSIFKKWRGDSISYWDDDTLVVHTNNFHLQHSDRDFLVSDNFEIEERFTLLTENEIHYRYVVSNPDFYTESWIVENTLTRMPAEDKLYDYACHEGNYSLPGILAGARRGERDKNSD